MSKEQQFFTKQDFPVDYFNEPDQNLRAATEFSPPEKSILTQDDFPADYFNEPEEIKTIKVYDENTSKTIEVPSSYDDKEVEYSATIAGAAKNPNNFIGMTEIPEEEGFFEKMGGAFSALGTGAKSSVMSLPQTLGSRLKEYAENQRRVPGGLDPIRAMAMQDLEFEDVVSPLPVNKALQKTADDMIKNNRAMLKREGLLRPKEGGLDGVFFDIGGVGTSVAEAVGLMALTKSAASVGVVFGHVSKSQMYIEAIEAGKTPQEAVNISNTKGLVTGLVSMVGIDRIFKIGAGDKIIKKILKRIWVEPIEEAIEQGADIGIKEVTGIKHTPKMQAAEEMAYAAFLGLVGGAPVVGVMSVAESRAKKAGITPEQIEQIKTAVAESEAIPRMEMLLEKENSGVASTPKSEADRANNIRKAIAETAVEAATARETEAVEFIKAEMSEEQQRQMGNIQAETDDIQVNILREIEDIQQTKTINDPKVTQLLEQTAEALKEKRKTRKPVTLSEFVADKGGIIDVKAELEMIGVPKNKRSLMNDTGRTVEDMGLVAFENGYFDERPTTEEFLDLFAADYKGNKVFSQFDAGEVQQLNDLDTLLNHVDEALGEEGITFNRELLKDVRRRIAANKQLDKTSVRKQKKATVAVEKLEAKKEKVAAKTPRIFADKLKTYVAGLKKGKVLAKQEIKDAQTQLIKLLDESKLNPEDKAKFIKTIKNIQTAEQLVKKLDDIEVRVRELEGKATRRKLRDDFIKELKAIKVTKQSGKPKGKFTPEIQESLDIIHRALKLPKEKAAALLNENLSNIEDIPSAQQALENRVLALAADGAEAPIQELKSLLVDVRSLKETGKLANKTSLLAKQEHTAALKAEVIDTVTEGENIHIQDNTSFRGKIKNIKKNIIAYQVGWNYGWFDVMDVIFNKKGVKNGATLRDKLMITELIQEAKGTGRRLSEALSTAAEKAFGIKDKPLLKKFAADAQTQDLGIFTNTAGVDVRLEYSVAEARKLWMEFQDPTLIETLTKELTKEEFRDGRGNGITPQMKDAIFILVTPADKSFAREQLAIYNKFYDEVNAKYSKIYGVNLPKNEFYSPISRQIGNESTVDEFLKEATHRRSVSSGGLKSRVANTRTLKKSSDVTVFQRHIAEMSHFIHFAEKAQELNTLFGNTAVRKSIQAKNGKYMLKVIDIFLADFTRGHVKRAEGVEKIVEYFNGAFAKSVLAAKPVLAAKQLVSVFAYADSMPVKDFISGMEDFAKNRKQAIKILSNTNLMQNRGTSIDQEIANSGTEKAFKFLHQKAALDEQLMMFIRWGDRGAIYAGGWAVYKHAIKQGKTHEQAVKIFEDVTSKAQQSRDIDQLSGLQRGNAYTRILTMFMSAPNAYFRAEVRAIRQWKRGKITKGEALKKIAIYHFVLPSLFQVVSDGFEWDEEHQLRVTALGSLNGFFALGDLISNGIASMQGDHFWGERSPFSAGEDVIGGIAKALQAVDMEDVLDATQDIAEGAGEMSGLPVKQVFNAATGVSEIKEGLQTNDIEEIVTGSKRVLGWSAGSVEN